MRVSRVAACVLATVVVGGCASDGQRAAPPAPAASGPAAATNATASSAPPTQASASSSRPDSRVTPSVPTTTAAKPAAPSAAPAVAAVTRILVVRPVDRAGGLSSGYVAVPESSDSIVCDWRSPSPVAVDAGILECGDSWHYGVACWPVAGARTALCDRDPFGRQLARIPAQFTTVGAVAQRPPVPFGLELDNGERCKIRDGGAWTRPEQQPSFVGYYECGSDFQDAVWASPGEVHGGIDESSPQWTVIVGKASGVGPLVRHRLVAARFVGMATAGRS